MKTILSCAMAFATAGLAAAADLTASAQSARIRVDTRQGLFGGKLATRVEAVGEPDGSDTSSWVTTNATAGVRDYADGWYARRDDGTGLKDWVALAAGETPDHDVLLLNDPLVLGGRLATNEVWSTGGVFIVRHNVVVPSGVTLTIGPETPVKFAEEARIVVEDGGAFVAQGAWLAEIADDDWVDGDTNLDGTNSVATGSQDWIYGVDDDGYVHVLLLDGAEQAFPTRTYTRGEAYGELPVLDRYDEGFHFRGWVTNAAETVGVAADQPADMDQPALYASWEAIYLNVATGLVTFAAYSVGETNALDVASNDRWTFSTDAEWLHVSAETASGELDGDGRLLLEADPNRSETPRSATVRVSRENGRLATEVSVVQAAMERARQPVVRTPGDALTFSDYMIQVAMSTETLGASIYYTTDGSEPSAENGIRLETGEHEGQVIGVINAYGSLTLKVVATRVDLLDSPVTTVRLVRDATLAEAMDIPDYYVTTDGTAPWQVVRDETYDGNSAVRSGAMTTSLTERRYSRLYTYVEGSGVLTFRWKVSCERDVTGNCDWDYLAFVADGQVVSKIEGETAWAEVTYRFTGTGAHVIQWFYTKNAGFPDFLPGRDCGWIDQVTWTPTLYASEAPDARELYADASWLMKVGIVGASQSDAEIVAAAQADSDGDGYSNEVEALLGTDPNDADSKLRVTITPGENGQFVVDWSPEAPGLDYRLLGVTELGGDWKDVTDLSEEERAMNGYRFFKVKVNVK